MMERIINGNSHHFVRLSTKNPQHKQKTDNCSYIQFDLLFRAVCPNTEEVISFIILSHIGNSITVSRWAVLLSGESVRRWLSLKFG